MARLARIVIPGLPHHVVHRAHERARLFRDDVDYARYRELLLHNCEHYGVGLSAFCLMPDHVHVVAVPPTREALSRAIGETGRLYARYRGQGDMEIWRSRFQSCPLDELHAKAAIAYVARNPDRAKFAAWRWRHPKSARAPAFEAEIETVRRSTRTGRPAGSAEFCTRLEYEIGRPLSPRKRGRKAKW
jgi:putative transposase